MATILLTGVTGLVGSCLAPILQGAGHRILYLIRGGSKENALARLHSSISKIGPNDIVLAGDVRSPNAGLSHQDLMYWDGKIDKIIHSAGSIKFDESAARDTWETNVDGTQTILQLATKLRVPEFHFVSTSYIAGDAKSFQENDIDIQQKLRNAYERSKREAERRVRSWPDIRFSIYRPSIIIGNSKTGYAKTLNGYYGFFIAFWQLRKSLAERWVTRRDECLREGIRMDDDEILHLPLDMQCSLTSTLNLVPTDWLEEVFPPLIELSATNQTYHLVHPNPPRVQWIIQTSLQYLKIGGLSYALKPRFLPHTLLERLQRGMNRKLDRYHPYINHEARFLSSNLERVLGSKYKAPPPIDAQLLQRMLEYAKSINFEQNTQVAA